MNIHAQHAREAVSTGSHEGHRLKSRRGFAVVDHVAVRDAQ
jgi:hypothetical protein